MRQIWLKMAFFEDIWARSQQFVVVFDIICYFSKYFESKSQNQLESIFIDLNVQVNEPNLSLKLHFWFILQDVMPYLSSLPHRAGDSHFLKKSPAPVFLLLFLLLFDSSLDLTLFSFVLFHTRKICFHLMCFSKTKRLYCFWKLF